MGSTYLTVPFAQKDQAKALGARWDASQRQWYVSEGVELAPFRQWLPTENREDLTNVSPSLDLVIPQAATALPLTQGVSLSQLLAGVEKAVAQAYQQGVWTRVDVVNVTTRNRHVYLELSERNEDGTVLAQARGAIWARTAERVLPEFERATGAQLAPGIKLLVLAKPVFKAQYGFSLEISGIDPSYTIGDLEAQKRKIREQLQAEQLFDRNKRLPSPWDFSRVLVVAPQGAAGLGDFAAEADRLQKHRLCEFLYAYSRFQGQGAAGEILAALQSGIEQSRTSFLDAVIIIRGGGAVNDLAWLNDYQLARFICMCNVPVLTGIGHERDSTVLDEVAHRSFDTPSKVIAAIEKQIAQRAREAKDAFERILVQGTRAAQWARIDSERLDAEIRTSARNTLSEGRLGSQSALSQVQLAALGQIHEGRRLLQLRISEIQDEAKQHVLQAKHEAPAAMTSIKELALAAVRSKRADVEALLPSVLDQVGTHAARATQDLNSTKRVLFERVQQTVKTAKSSADGLMREVAGQGPKKTLARGFAIVRDPDGKTVTSAKAAKLAKSMAVAFNDGIVQADVSETPSKEKQGDANDQ